MTLKAMSWAVTVDPMLAPRMTARVCSNDISPEVTNPTSSTVVTEEDWTSAVIPAPVTRPPIVSKSCGARFPAIVLRQPTLNDSVIRSIPSRKMARPAQEADHQQEDIDAFGTLSLDGGLDDGFGQCVPSLGRVRPLWPKRRRAELLGLSDPDAYRSVTGTP